MHAAAYADVAGAESDRETYWRVNVEGTRHLVQCSQEHSLVLIHISTDHVFYNDKGSCQEEDPVGLVRNYYALSKLVSEELVRLRPRHIVIRTSFRPALWPYPVAFTDVRTSQDYVDVISPNIALAILIAAVRSRNTLHIPTEPKSAFQLALRRRPDVRSGSRKQDGVCLHEDISLDIHRWETRKKNWKTE